MSRADLQIEDSREAKFDLVFRLAADPVPRLPVYIMSHRRSADLRTLRTLPRLRPHVTVVVRQQEMEEYRRDLSGVRLLPIPVGWGGSDIGLGRAHQFTLEMASLLGQEHIITMDDDLTQLTLLYAEGDRASRAFQKHLGKERTEDFQWGVFQLFAEVSLDAFSERPLAVVTSPQNQNANRTTKASALRWESGMGGNPGLMQTWAVDRFLEATGGGIDLDRFYHHGDDVGALLQIIEAGHEAVKVPSIIGDSYDCETRSVIRTADTADALRHREHEALMSMALAKYVKTKTDFLDRPQWHSVDWPALHRAGLAVRAPRLWTDPVA